MVCSTFKGISAHELAVSWLDPVYGAAKLEIDIHTAGEIMDQINEATAKSGSKARKRNSNPNSVVARMKQARKARGGK